MSIPSNSYQVTLNWTGTFGGRENMATVIGVSAANTSLEEAAEAVGTAAVPTLVAGMSDKITLTDVRADSQTQFALFAVGEAGGEPAEQCPSNCALLVRKRSGLKGRQNQGRMYLPGWLPESKVNGGGVITNQWVSDAQDSMDAFYAGLVAGGVPMRLLHLSTSSSTSVVDLLVENRIATQRRRIGR